MSAMSENVAASEEASRVLVVCGVAGQFERVFKRVAQLHASSSGPFDLLLCVGDFFAAPSGEQLADESKAVAVHQLSDYIEGFKQAPLPTYFIAGPHEDRFLPGTREQLAPNIFYLGRFGIARLRGLRIAYVSGQFGATPADCSPFLRHGFDSLVSTWASDVRRGVDVLLTNEWPRHLLAGLDAPPPALGAPSALGVDGVVTVVRALKPRYHFAPAVNDVFFQRAPYANRASLADFGRTHATRFIALARADNAAKQRHLFAVNLKPIEAMDDAVINELPADCTNSPFVLADAAAAADAATSSTAAAALPPPPVGASATVNFVKSGTKRSLPPLQQVPPPQHHPMAQRWAQEVQFSHPPSGGGGGKNKRARVVQAQRPCWFCLKSPDVEKHLIVSVASNLYVALPKGGLADDHLLIVAIEHIQQAGDLSSAGVEELAKYKASITRYYASLDREPLFYERFVLLHNEAHMHVQAVPLPRNSSVATRDAFLAAARERGVTFVDGTKPETLGGHYLHVELADGSTLTQSIGVASRDDIQFSRRVCAQLLGKPDAVDWKKCALDRPAETALANAVRQRFAAFDWSANDDE